MPAKGFGQFPHLLNRPNGSWEILFFDQIPGQVFWIHS
jgi:hypothetical protein